MSPRPNPVGDHLLPDDFFGDEDPDTVPQKATISSILRRNIFSEGKGETHWSALYEVSDLINSQAYDFDATAGSILDMALAVPSADRGILILVDKRKDLYLKIARNIRTEDIEEGGFLRAITERTLEVGRPVLAGDTLDDGLPTNAAASAFGASSYMAVPLRVRVRGHDGPEGSPHQGRRRYVFQAISQVMGVIYVDRGPGRPAFGERDLRVLESLTGHVTTVLINARLYQMATVDALTRFLIRGQLDAALTVELTLAENTGAPLAVLMVDIDNFRHVNDQYGHVEGGRIIGAVADVIRGQVRRDDVCVRYGGEEFLLILPNTNPLGAKVVAEKVRAAVEAARLGENRLAVTVSLGIACYPQHGETKQDLIKKADQALYEAKHEGRNCFRVWSEKLSVFSLRADKLTGIITGDQAKDYHNVMGLLDTVGAIQSTLELDELLTIVIDNIISVTGADRGVLMLADDGGDLRTRVAQDRERRTLTQLEDFAEDIPRKVFTTGNPICFVDSRTDPRRENPLRMRTVMCVPVVMRNRLMGVVYVDTRSATRKYNETDLTFLQALTRVVGAGMEKARLYEENERKRVEVEELNRRLEEKVHIQAAELEEVKDVLNQNLDELKLKYNYEQIVGKSPRMQEVYKLLDRITDVDVPVLINGESGTGKELIAKAIHFNGPRKARRFVSVNCAAISESLLESELFGHVKGAFTGAEVNKKGLFELADKGTIFLDEVGDMSEGMQKKLLRVLQEGEVRPVGGKEVIRVNVRIASATNRDLKELMQKGIFRKDLYYRLNVVNIKLPPLRERKEDIPLLVDRFLEEYAAEHAVEKPAFDKKALAKLVRYHWPGNIRELKNFVERTALLASGPLIQEEELHLEVEPGAVGESDFYDLPYSEARDRYLRAYLINALRRAGGNVTRAARDAQMVRSSFHKLMNKFKIDKV